SNRGIVESLPVRFCEQGGVNCIHHRLVYNWPPPVELLTVVPRRHVLTVCFGQCSKILCANPDCTCGCGWLTGGSVRGRACLLHDHSLCGVVSRCKRIHITAGAVSVHFEQQQGWKSRATKTEAN